MNQEVHDHNRGITAELRHHLRTGQAGWPIRAALSLTCGLLLATLLLVTMWVIVRIRVRFRHYWVDESTFAAGAALIVPVWCLLLHWIWRGYRHGKRFLRTALSIIGLWGAVIPACILIDEFLRGDEELLIAACVFAGLAATIMLVALNVYRYSKGKTLYDEEQSVAVHCPECNYPLNGLSESRCPECGMSCTIDQLIHRQQYEALRAKPARALTNSSVSPE